ncbi:protein Lines homolog 1 isoform X2 [Rhinoraja longicauda]
MMEKCLIYLRQFYSEILAGVKPGKSSHEQAAFLSPDVSEKDCTFSIEMKKSNPVYHFHGDSVSVDSLGTLLDHHSSKTDGQNEMLLLQMNMIHLLSSKLYSEIPREDVRETYLKTITILLEEMEIIPKLKLPIDNWMNSCLDILSKEPGSQQSAHWAQAITVIVKDILKGKSQDKTGTLQKLLIPMDSVLHNLYLFTFSSCSGSSQTSGDFTEPDDGSVATISQLAVVHLLEVMVGIRNHLELNLSCLKTLYLHTPLVLDFVTSSAQYFIKKKLILLLKMCILGQASDDACNPCHAGSQQDSHLHEDLLGVSCTLLQAVRLGWLSRIPVNPRPCLFGGSEILDAENTTPGPDMVMLRTVSLILIKAMEINLKNTMDTVKAKGCLKNELQSCLSQLMLFLRMHLQGCAQFQQLPHPCAWVSFIFVEQDDDLVDVASALLTIYTHCPGFVETHAQENAATSQEAHGQWFNPHCIFLLLLKSLAFDHQVLLDFLISSETCFLEYLVKYLHLLRRDWQSFCCICAQFDTSSEPLCPPPDNQGCKNHDFVAEIERDSETLRKGSRNTFVSPQIPQPISPKEEPGSSCDPDLEINSKMTQLLRLVDYNNSDNSDSDDEETTCLNIGSKGDIEMSNTGTADETVQQKAETMGNIKDVNTYSCENNPETELSSEGMLKKFMGCLSELRKTIGRLQGRALFPYNATPLLKLLLDIETCNQTNASSA